FCAASGKPRPDSAQAVAATPIILPLGAMLGLVDKRPQRWDETELLVGDAITVRSLLRMPSGTDFRIYHACVDRGASPASAIKHLLQSPSEMLDKPCLAPPVTLGVLARNRE